MKKHFYTFSLYVLPLAFLIAPVLLFAGQGGQGLVPCQDNCTFQDLFKLFNNIVNGFLTIAVSIAAITFAIAGGRILLNPENSGEREKAKEMFKKSIYGLIIIMVAWLAVRAVVSFLTGSQAFLQFLR